MTLALVAALVMVSAYAVIQHLAMRRLLRAAPDAPPEPELIEGQEKDAGEAILELIEAKLIDCPDEWESEAGAVTHKPSGVRLLNSGNAMTISRGNVASLVPPEWRVSPASIASAQRTRMAKFG
jgi:hypothetical protein